MQPVTLFIFIASTFARVLGTLRALVKLLRTIDLHAKIKTFAGRRANARDLIVGIKRELATTNHSLSTHTMCPRPKYSHMLQITNCRSPAGGGCRSCNRYSAARLLLPRLPVLLWWLLQQSLVRRLVTASYRVAILRMVFKINRARVWA
jgi:hypothetical protein